MQTIIRDVLVVPEPGEQDELGLITNVEHLGHVLNLYDDSEAIPTRVRITYDPDS